MSDVRVLVTGASGFLGRHVALGFVRRGLAVVGLDPVEPEDAPPYRHIGDDLGDEGRLRDLLAEAATTHIVHLGGVSGPDVLADRPDLIMRINVQGSLNLLQASLATGVRTFVYGSSVSAMGEHLGGPLADDADLRPINAYGHSKAAVDLVLKGLHGRVALDLCSLRYTGLYGPGRKTPFTLDRIVRAGLEGKAVAVPPATPWPYLFVTDAAEATIAAALATTRRQLFYNLAHPEAVRTADIAAAVAALTGPFPVSYDLDARLEVRAPLAIDAAIRDFGFAPKVDHREGIRRMVEAARG
jgi:UDP-glucose 4-epimerase